MCIIFESTLILSERFTGCNVLDNLRTTMLSGAVAFLAFCKKNLHCTCVSEREPVPKTALTYLKGNLMFYLYL